MFEVNNKDTKQHKKEHQSIVINVVLVSLLLTLNIVFNFFSSVSNVACKHVFFCLNMTTSTVVATAIYVNTTVIMTMAATITMIMTMITTTAMTKNILQILQQFSNKFKKTIFIACLK